MPARGATNNTMAEGLRRVMSEIADLKLAPDADIEFLTGIETSILAYVRERIGGQQPQMGSFGGPSLGGGGGAAPMTMAGPGAGITPRPAMPPADELRRLLQTEGV